MSRARLLLFASVLAPLAGWAALYRLSDDLLRPPRPRLDDPAPVPAAPPVASEGDASAGGATAAPPEPTPPLPLPRSPAELGLPFREIEFPGGGGLTARGWYVPAPEGDASIAAGGADAPRAAGPRGGSIVFLHGNASNRRAALRMAPVLHDAGFALLMFDFTGRGDSDGELCTYGVREAEDARQAARFVAAQRPGEPVAFVGRSLGASVALLAAADPQGAPVDAVVADSPYASLSELVSASRSDMHIPAWPFEPLFYAMVRWRAGFDPRDIDIEGAARRVTVPVLLLHGADDHDIPPAHSHRIEAALAGRREFVEIPQAGHNTPRSADVIERIRSFLVKELRGGPAVEL